MGQKWYQKASVQGALAGGLALIVAALIPVAFQVPRLNRDISRLEAEVAAKTAELHRV